LWNYFISFSRKIPKAFIGLLFVILPSMFSNQSSPFHHLTQVYQQGTTNTKVGALSRQTPVDSPTITAISTDIGSNILVEAQQKDPS